MIVYAPAGTTSAPSVSMSGNEQASVAPYAYFASAGGSTPPEVFVQGIEGVAADIQPAAEPMLESFNWQDKKLNREFTRLQQRVLARKASNDERERYEAMKRDRNGKIFADRYLHDYAEVERLKKLSQKLAEVQQYLRPIRF